MAELILDSRWPYTIIDPPQISVPESHTRLADLTNLVGADERLQNGSLQRGSLHWRTLLMASLRKGARAKRVCDLSLTVLGGIVCFPFMALIALAIKLSSRGP